MGNNLDYIASEVQPILPATTASFMPEQAVARVFITANPLGKKPCQAPDARFRMSRLADPFTGVVVIFTSAGQQYAEAGIGGTSLASPLFTSIWAIADQYNGSRSALRPRGCQAENRTDHRRSTHLQPGRI